MYLLNKKQFGYKQEILAACFAVRIELVLERICPTRCSIEDGKAHFAPNSPVQLS
jgi:hypothetical protein